MVADEIENRGRIQVIAGAAAVLRGGRMNFLDQVQGTHRLRAVSSIGEVFPVTSKENGRACIALMPETDAEWERLGLPGDWPRLAEDLDDHTDGINALRFAFLDMTGTFHAISVRVPTPHFAMRRAAVTEAPLQVSRDRRRILGN